jgi:hypothetical protein
MTSLEDRCGNRAPSQAIPRSGRLPTLRPWVTASARCFSPYVARVWPGVQSRKSMLVTDGDLLVQFSTWRSRRPCLVRVKRVAVSEPFGSPRSVLRCTCPTRTTGSPRHLRMVATAATVGVPGRNMTWNCHGGPHCPPQLSVLQPAVPSSPGTSNRTIAGTVHPSSLRRMDTSSLFPRPPDSCQILRGERMPGAEDGPVRFRRRGHRASVTACATGLRVRAS